MTKKLFLLLLLFCFVPVLCSASGISSAEVMYQVTGPELQTLESIFNKQETIISQLQTELSSLKTNDRMSKESLETALEELQKTKIELMLLRQDLENSNKALALANKSLHAYESEMKRKNRIIKTQRGFAYTLAAGGLIYAAVK